MFVNFSEEVKRILKQAEIQRDELKHPYVGSEHLFLSMLKDSRLIDIFKKNKITYDKFREKLVSLIGIGSKKNDFILYTPFLKRILENSVIEAREQNNKIVSPELIVILILDEENGVAYSVLKSMNINIDKLYFDLRRKKGNKKRMKKLLIDELGTNLNKLAIDKKIDPVIGREKEINSTIEILLRRKKNNPILVGPAGVGKTAIIEGIASLLESDKCPFHLKNKKIISLDIFSLVSGTKYRGEFEEKMKSVIKELEENPDIILFVDEIHTIVGAGGAEGAIDASNILKPTLARGSIKIIGATTLDEYKKYIEPDAALARRFQKVIVEEPDSNSVIKILSGIKPLYEKYHNIKISDELIKDIVYLSDKYLSNRFEPDRSIDILDEVCVKTSFLPSASEKKKKSLQDRIAVIKKQKLEAISKGDFKKASDLKSDEYHLLNDIKKIKDDRKEVNKKDIIQVIKNKGNIKLISLSKDKFYMKLKSNLNNKIINQEKNIDLIIKSLIKKDISSIKKVYSILISGKTGTGKTYIAESLLSEIMSKKDIIKIDLSEYKEYYTVSKLIGTTAGYTGYDNKNNVFEKVRTNPSVGILIENYDMACYEVQYVFNRILENGYIEDGSGNKIDFTNAILIFTQNLSENISVGFKKDENIEENELEKRVLVGVKIKPYDYETKKKIINLKINDIITSYGKIKINVDESYYKFIYNKFKNKDNIKEINSFIQKDMDNIILDDILKGDNNITISYKERSIVI